MNTGTKSLSIGTKLGYGICDMGGNLFFTVMSFWLMIYLTDTVGIAPFWAGAALFIGRVFDAFADPAVGYISDKTVTRWGKRRPYIFIGAFLVAASIIYLFMNPHLHSQVSLFIWAAVAFTALSFSYTVVNIPYSSLTPALTADYNERTSLNSFRFTFAIIGTFIGAGAAKPIIDAFSKHEIVNSLPVITDKSSGYAVFGIICGLVMGITALITFFSVREKITPAVTAALPGKAFKAYLSTFKNKPYMLIVLTWLVNTSGVTILAGMVTYFFNYVRRSPDQITLVMIILLLSSMVFIPFWVLVSKLIGKKKSYMAGMGIVAVMMVVFFLVGKTIDFRMFLVLVGICGIGFSTGYLLPWSILPDAIDYDYAKTGEKKEGIYYGLWTFYSKIGQGFAALLMGFLLQLGHYIEPRINTSNLPFQPETAQLAIRLLFGPIGAVFYLIGVGILFFYPIDKKRYEAIQKEIEAIEKGIKA